MNIFSNQVVKVELPILARMWQEDDVWNVSAFDLPVVAFGEDFRGAQAAFEDALLSHFEVLAELGILQATMDKLIHAAHAGDFWPSRVRPKETVHRFAFDSASHPELCLV